MKAKILVVEDDETLQETLVWNLERQGYKVAAAANGRTALNLARKKKPDLIILDVMLPELDGIDICRILRKESATPILMLTARAEEVDKIVGLEIGADDYMTKPFSMRELLVRVKALLRRVDMIREEVGRETAVSPPPSSLTFGSLTIDEERREVRLDNQIVKLKPKEFELLLFLARHQGVALSRSLILEKVWGWTFDGNSRTVDVHVRWLREKIEADPAQPQRIVTVRGVGYRFD
ncbi:MAG: response regulator transcription factor [Chloroflexi bacterium]|nr:response regulator transcription factor [Chloroflexota bacterium]